MRGFHWNVQGQNFFELHLKFEEFYTDLQVKIDEVAERIMTLGGKPLHAMQDYVAGATIPAVKDVTDGVEAVRHCAAAYGVLLVRERGILALSDKANDEGTNALMSDYIREREGRHRRRRSGSSLWSSLARSPPRTACSLSANAASSLMEFSPNPYQSEATGGRFVD